MTAMARISEVTFDKNKKLTEGARGLDVMFNPSSLKVAVSNKLQDEESKPADNGKAAGGKGQQSTRVTTTKLDTELVFDTTETGDDVRSAKNGTQKLKDLATAPEGDHPTPPMVQFRWGSFAFVGVIESFNETLDFWAAEGIPLRSTVQISMQETKRIDPGAAKATLAKAKRQAVVKVPSNGQGTSGAASDHGNPGAGRALAAANGIEDMRMSAGGEVAVSASIDFQAAASFSLSASASAGAGASAGFGLGASASAGASVGIGASAGASAGIGIGAGASAGIGAGASAGIGAGASASFGAGASAGLGAGASASAGIFGGSATAGVSASAGAFAGLGSSKTTSVALPFDPARLLPPPSTPLIGRDAQFDVTGKLVSSSSSSGGAVSASAHASAGVSFF